MTQPELNFRDGSMASSDVANAKQSAGSQVDFTPGDVLGSRYQLMRKLGEQPGAVTWLASDTILSRTVSVMLLNSDTPAGMRAVSSARQAAAATDSRFVRVLDAITREDFGYSVVITEYVSGITLTDLYRTTTISPVEGAWIVREMADAMAAEHEHGRFHLRINPDRVMITSSGAVKIVGHLVASALTPLAGDDLLTPRQKAAIDARDLGKILYANTVRRWPAEPNEQGSSLYGLPVAPHDQYGLLTPRQVIPGVSPALDIVCDQALSNVPRHNETPITNCYELASGLSHILGMADASADLEARIRSIDLNNLPTQQTANLSENAAAANLSASAAESPATESSASADQPGLEAAKDEQSTSSFGDGASPIGFYNIWRPSNNRRWLAILLGVVGFILAISLLISALAKGGGGNSGEPNPQPSTATTASTTPTAVAIKSATVFDPKADGGDADENSQYAKLAIDGDSGTAWSTSVYKNDAKLANLKPGVGLVLDLSEELSVSAVELNLEREPTGVAVYVPNEQDIKKSMESIKVWTEVSHKDDAPKSVSLQFSEPVKTRYLLVYLTKLPQIREDRFQGGIFEIKVLANS